MYLGGQIFGKEGGLVPKYSEEHSAVRGQGLGVRGQGSKQGSQFDQT